MQKLYICLVAHAARSSSPRLAQLAPPSGFAAPLRALVVDGLHVNAPLMRGRLGNVAWHAHLEQAGLVKHRAPQERSLTLSGLLSLLCRVGLRPFRAGLLPGSGAIAYAVVFVP